MSDDLGEFREFENGVRRGLSEMAGRIQPSDRLDAIVAAGEPRRRSAVWLVSAAAVFILVAALGIGYLLTQTRTSAMTSSAGGAAPAEKDAQAQSVPAGDSSTRAATVPSSSPEVATGSWAMPVYWVVTGSQSQPWLLTRTFQQVQVPTDRTVRVQTAVGATVGIIDTGWGAPMGVQRPWVPGTSVSATVTDSLITLELSRPGVSGLTAQQQKIAVQGLVWTATAAAQLTVPVRIQVAGGGAMFSSTPAGTYTRPGSDLSYTELVPIWVDAPSLNTTVHSPVTVTGEACVFEAQFSYELLQGSTVVKQGSVTTSSGCPSRGTYSIPLGTLAPGAYTLRLYETSMKDGSVFYETRTAFGVS